MTGSEYSTLNVSTPGEIDTSIDLNDKGSMFRSRDEFFREQLVRAQEIAVVRDKLGWCYKREGVNHYEKCRDLAVQYMDLLKEMKEGTFRAYKRPDLKN